MGKNSAWKRAGCVLLAAQMTVSVLPINSMAAYGDVRSKSSAILEARINGKAVHAGRDQTLRLGKDQMPLLSKHVVSFAARETIAPDASSALDADSRKETDADTDDPVGTAEEGQGLPAESSTVDIGPPTDSDTEQKETTPLDGTGEGSTEPGQSGGGETPTTAPPTEGEPPGEGEGSTGIPPTEGELPGEGEGSTGIPPTEGELPGEGEGSTGIPPTEGELPGEGGGSTETPPTEGELPGEGEGSTGTPPTEGELPGEGEGSTETPPTEGEPPGEGGESTGTPPPEGTEIVVPPGQAADTLLPSTAETLQPLGVGLPTTLANDLTLHIIHMNIYGYNGWAGKEGRGNIGIRQSIPSVEGKGGGANYLYPPYNWETEPGYNDGLQGIDHIAKANVIQKMDGSGMDAIVDEEIATWATRKLSRIPDLKFKGWIFSQVNPSDKGGSFSNPVDREDEMSWNNRYWSKEAWDEAGVPGTYYEDPFEGTFEAALDHADVNLTVPYGDTGAGFDMTEYTVNVVAKWVKSNRADLTKLSVFGLPLGKSGDKDKQPLELYGTDFTVLKQKDQQPVKLKTYSDSDEIKADGIKDEYYIQVPVQTDRLTLDFTTYEPGTMIRIEADSLQEPILYRYDREGYVWFETDGSPSITKDRYDERNVDPSSILIRKQPGRATGRWGSATNSYEDPARANWSLPAEYAIPLELTSPKDVYTDVTIKVVAPDGDMDESGTSSGTTATYTLHVRRMDDPEMKLNPGNTPYGMIEGETNLAGGWSKDRLREHFDANRAFPTGVAILLSHNGGAVYQGKFSDEAWPQKDYDKSETALVVYQDATFTDPGFTLTDSQGETVDSRDLKRSIRLRRVSALTTESIHQGAGEEVYYQAGALTPAGSETVLESVDTEGGKDQISLKGLNIVPGIYTIEYSYEDPASQRTYNSVDTSVYMNATRAADFSRPLIVLPKPGDVDMDGMITLADAIALEELLKDPNSFVNVDSSDEIERLFKYRVCDVDSDGKVTETDVAKLKEGYVPRQRKDMATDYFYLNAGDRGERERKDLIPEPASPEKAEILVEYLGVDVLGVPSGVIDATAEVELRHTFWVGVRLKNARALPNYTAGVKGFEFTLLYNPSILSPGLLQDASGWKQTVEWANLSGTSTTPWKDAYTLVGNSGPGGSLIPYPELALPGLPNPEGELASYTIALQLKPEQTAHSLSEGYLLYIPFTMESHPAGIEHSTVPLVEPAMGGREFSIVYTDGTAAAWSGQDDVFGGNTQELKTSLTYTGAAAIPVGEDKTPCITLYQDELDDDGNVQNACYGEAFHFSGANTSAGPVDLMNTGYTVESGSLPPGMDYDPDSGVIATNSASGATKAGAYRFYINGVLYRIIVDKAPLTLTVAGGARNRRFYGEGNPDPTIMEFGYEPSQLKKPELDRISREGLTNSGRGRDLEAILADTGYKHPTIVPVDKDGQVLTFKVPAGEYTTELTGGLSTNYVFQYLRQGETEPNKEKATNSFSVDPRPIVIERIEGPVGKMDSKPKDDIFSLQLTARNGTGAGNFVAKLPDDPDYHNGSSMSQLTGNPVLTEDDLRLTYVGQFEKMEKDKPFEFTLDPENVQEERAVSILKNGSAAPRFTGSQAANYQIYEGTSIPDQTTGTVIRVPVTELELVRTDINHLTTEYTYGDTLALANMGDIILRWANGAEEGPFPFNDSFNQHGVMLCWVEKKGDLPSAATSIPGYNAQPLTAKEHDGKYLCVYVSNGKSYPEACAYLGPYTVHKAELTLTVASQTRYYGEPNNESPRITYSISDLKGDDRKLYQSGTIQDLVGEKGLAGFRNLEISYRETASANGRLVNRKTDVGNYFVVLAKAEADNYTITYQQRNQSGQTHVSKEFGYAAMTVTKRPVRVDRITGTVGFFYDDTSTKVMTVHGAAPAGANQGFTLEITSPTEKYWTTEGVVVKEQELGELTQSAIVGGDTLTFTYRATFDSDAERKPFFDTKGWDTDRKSYGVTIDNLRLDTATGAGRNYQLVYDDSEHALNGQPQSDDRGSGDVVIRRIDHLEVRALPQILHYTYGDGLRLDGSLAVRVYYTPENGYSSYEDIIYYQHRVDNVVTGDTFADNGLWLEWSDENGKPIEGEGPEAFHEQLMTVTDHNGRYLVVKGKHHDSHEEKVVVVSQPVTVAKKVLHVKARDITRGYGQENLSSGVDATYGVVVDWKNELIPEDWERLSDSGEFDMDYEKTLYDPAGGLAIYVDKLAEAAASPALAYLDPSYVGPEFRTQARNDTPVGKYELVLSGGKLANYDFEFKPGVIEVTKRRIYLTQINKYPLATMVVDSGVGVIHNVMATYSSELKEVDFFSGVSGQQAILNDDEITVSMTVEFGYRENGTRVPLSDLTIPDGQATEKTWVKISNVRLVQGKDSGNYELANDILNNQNPVYLGRLDGRQIDRIEFSNPGAIRTQYDYGDSLDLLGLKINIYYKSAPGESSTPVERNVEVTSRSDLSLHYLADPSLAENDANWADIAEGRYGKAAAADFLRIARDEDGFAHDGMYLVVSAKASRNPGDYVEPLVVGTPLSITPRTLRYTLTADTKPYDGTTKAWGTVRMDMNQIDPGDVVYVDNGTRYDAMEMEQEGTNYLFPSNETYGVGFRFVFSDRNVAYEQTPGHDDYGTLKAVSAGVENVTLSGKDAANYRLERESVPSSDPAAPSAIITRAFRPAPDTAAVTNMSTDIHTNTVTVFVDKDAPSCGDLEDTYNDELHYEYKLEYLTDETDLASGFRWVEEEDRDSPFFGGEPVEVTSDEFEPAPGEKNELTPGMGQPCVEGDNGFGQREALPRDTYFRALVRLAGTHNYEPSAYTASVSDADMTAAIAAARAAEESDEIDPVLTDPEAIEPPRAIPEKQSLGKTYQYRIDVVSAQTMRGTDNKEHVRSQLDSVWFADRATYPREDYLNALLTNTEEPRYQAYSWDDRQERRVNFPLDMEETVVVNMPQEDGSTALQPVCGPETGGTIRLYASLVPLRGGGGFYALTILNGDITAHVGDDPVQLRVQVEPDTELGLFWYSSDVSVVSVDEDGVLTFVGEGTARIRVSYGGYSASITVTVLPRPELPKELFNWDYLGAFMELTDELLFYPERTMSRGELATILDKFLSPFAEQPEGEAPEYVDLDEDMACFQAVNNLNRMGLWKGVGESRFAPDQTVTRAEMAALLVRMGSLPAAPTESQSFLDGGPEDTWAWAEIAALKQAGITRGTGASRFNPDRPLTRAEAAVLLTRMLRYKLDPKQEGLIQPVDVEEEYWAWREIMQAVNGANMPEESR